MKWNYQIAQSRIKLFGGLALAIVLSFSQSAWALGTASGTPINNLATLSYSVSGVAQTAIGSSPTGNSVGAGTNTVFVVDNKVNLTVLKQDGSRVNVTNGQVAATPLPNPPAFLTFVVTNTGNTTQDYKLSFTNPAAGATDPFGSTTNFATANCRTFLESGGAPLTLQIGTDTEVTATPYINNLAADGTQRVYLVCDTPVTATNLQTGVAGLIAEAVDAAGTAGAPSASYTVAQLTAANTQAGVEIVAADLAGTEAGDVARDAKASDRDTYIIATATLTVTKTATPICDPFNGPIASNPKNIPGADVQYAITIANTGSVAATLTSVSDTLVVALLTFDPALNSGATAAGCVSGGGTSLSATGFGAKAGPGVGPGVTAPGVAADAVSAGATFASPNITINFSTLTTGAIAAGTASTLAASSFITVYFNAFVK